MTTGNPPAAGAELERRLERVERALYEEFYAAAPPDLVAAHGIRHERRGEELRLSVDTLDHPFFNRVMGIGLDGAPDREWLLAHAARYRSAGVSRFMFQVLPHVESDGLRGIFAESGIERLRGWAKHVGPAGAVPAARSDLRVEAIGAERAADWTAICAGGFGFGPELGPWLGGTLGRPGWRHYLALDGDEPAATAALFVHGEFAVLGFAATAPEHRRRGAQSALIARRLRDAAELGCRWAVSETDEELPDRPNPSCHNVVRMGLPVRYVRANWGPPK